MDNCKEAINKCEITMLNYKNDVKVLEKNHHWIHHQQKLLLLYTVFYLLKKYLIAQLNSLRHLFHYK